MRRIRASDAKTHLPRLLSEVERGETIVITRHGRPIARLVPEAEQHREVVERTFDRIDDFRKSMPNLPLEDILSARHEGHKY
jgi:prevent-host-death family protein